MVKPKETTVVQTHESPMTALDTVMDHATAVRALVTWNSVGVLMDEGPHAVVTVLLNGDVVVSALRFCLSAQESVGALRAYDEESANPMELRCWQGRVMTGEQSRDLAELTTIWRESSGQRQEQAEEDWLTFFDRIERETRTKGRGTGITGPTRNRVLLDAHGRCMFEGCGADLTEDPVTHERGTSARWPTTSQRPRAVPGVCRACLAAWQTIPRTSCCFAIHTIAWWIRSRGRTIRQLSCLQCGGASARRQPRCSTRWRSRPRPPSAWRGPCTGRRSRCRRRSRWHGR